MAKQSNRKCYALNQSPIYKLKSRKKLAALFGLSLKELELIVNRNDNYKVFTIGKDIKKPRTVEVPKPYLERLHRRVFNLLSRIEPPEYLHSGVKGRSYITNAQEHIGAKRLIKLDFKKFFPSTLGWHVFEFYYKVMGCSKDVAGLLTAISTHDGHVPTGSCISQVTAFYAHYEMFQEISLFTKQLNLKMTCYVDDLAISGDAATSKVLYKIRGIIRRRGLVSPKKKEFVYGLNQTKLVTGSVVTDDGLRLPNRKHKQIHDEVNLLIAQDDSPDKLELMRITLGRVISACQSDDLIKNRLAYLTSEKNRIYKLVNNNL